MHSKAELDVCVMQGQAGAGFILGWKEVIAIIDEWKEKIMDNWQPLHELWDKGIGVHSSTQAGVGLLRNLQADHRKLITWCNRHE